MLRTCIIVALLVLSGTGYAGAAERPLRVAVVETDWAPMEFRDRQGRLTGFSIDYIQAVADAAGFGIEFCEVPWLRIFDGLLVGEYDIAACSISITEERKGVVDFSLPYFEARQALVIRADEDIRSLEELKGKILGAQRRTTAFAAIAAMDGVRGKPFAATGEAMDALARYEVDGVVCDEPAAISHVLESREGYGKKKVALVLPAEEPERYAFAVAKGNGKILSLLNKGIILVQERGIETDLRRKWIGR